MTKSMKLIATATGLICLASVASLKAQFRTDQAFWNQEHIAKAFASSYSIKAKTEPNLSEEEQVAVKQVLDFLQGGGEQDEALEMILREIDEESSAALDFIAGNFYAEKGELKQAIRYYDQATEKYPSFLRAFRNSGIMKVKEGRFQAALKDLTKAIELGAKDTTTMGLLGLSYVNTEKYFSAETAYREAIVLDPTVKDWQVGLAKSLLQQRKYTEGIAVIEQILVDEPENEILLSSIADAYLGLDDPETSVAIHEIVDRLGKSSPESLVFMGRIYLSRGLNELSLSYFERAIGKEPDQDPEVYINIADAMTGRGNYDGALKILERTRSSFASSLSEEDKLWMLRLQAQIALATDQGEKVIPILEELIQRDPLDGQALLLLGEFYSNKDDFESHARADMFFERAAKVEQWQVRALISHARSYVSRKDYGKAIPLLERAQVLEPQEYIGRYLEQVRKIYIASRGL